MPTRPIGVLCVESNEAVCETLKLLLKPPRFRWLGAVPSLEELDAAVERDNPDLVVIALYDDHAALAWARRQKERRPGLRVALLVSGGDPDVLAEAFEGVVDALVSKFDAPADIPRLLAAAAEGHPVIGPEVIRLLTPPPPTTRGEAPGPPETT